MITVRKTIDHPCQLKTAYKILDMGFIPFRDKEDVRQIVSPTSLAKIHFLREQDRWPTNFIVSRSFPFDWPSYCLTDRKTDLYIKKNDKLETIFVPASEDLLSTLPGQTPLWLNENDTMARIIWEEPAFLQEYNLLDNRKDWELVGTKGFEEYCAIFTRKKKSNEYALTLNNEVFSNENYVLKISFLSQDGLERENSFEFERLDLVEPFLFHLPDNKQFCGIIYSLYAIVDSDSLDIWDPFESISSLWTYDHDSRQAINVATGNPVAGRQDFPDVFEPDGTLCITHKDQLLDRKGISICQKGIDYLLLSHTESMQIESELDLLQYRILKKTSLQ